MLFSMAVPLILLAALAAASPAARKDALPIIDLGYVKQQASSYNATGGYYYFNNIAFARPPVGNLRWAAPLPPKPSKTIQNGRFASPQCPQATPAWLLQQSSSDPEMPIGPNESEDCLYLDVIVPEKILKQKHRASAPVLTWIYGGGNVIGSKGDVGNGLVERSMHTTNSDGAIYVAMNYRLGAFAYFGGSEYKSQGGAQNLGLLDQKLALEWIQQHICEFGGDANRVTVIGESGGAGAIGHHLTAPVYEKRPPFRQAIFQSPADLPEVATEAFLHDQYESFLKGVNVTSLQQARALDTLTLQEWNRKYNYASPPGSFLFFATIDNDYVVSNVYQGLAAGRFDHSVKILTAHNSQEGAIFTPDLTNFDFTQYVKTYTPRASNSTVEYITNVLYPASAFPGPGDRANAFYGDILIDCVHYSVQRAFNRQGPAYLFAIPPGFHVQDVPYTFYNGDNSANVSVPVALDMQTWLVNFAVNGNPNANSRTPKLPIYGQKGNMLQLTQTKDSVVPDPNNNKRCEYWATYR